MTIKMIINPFGQAKITLNLVLVMACLFMLLPGPGLVNEVRAESGELRSGWYPDEPYQMETGTGERRNITGLDIQIARDLFEKAGYRISFDRMSWSDIIQGLRKGETDFLTGAYYEERREEFAYYSVPYRNERNAVYYHKSIRGLNKIRTLDGLLEFMGSESLNLAVIGEHAYGSKRFEDLLSNPPANLNLIPSDGYSHSLNLTAARRADLFVSNPIIMDRLLAETGYSNIVQKSGVKGKEIPVHILFSKKNISLQQLEEFNSILSEMKDTGRIRSLHKDFVLPAYLSITTGQTWFMLLTFLGITAFCTSGVLLARKERYNIFGAMVLATLPAIGGGVLRDLFLGADQIFVLETPAYFLVAIGVVGLAFAIFKSYDFLNRRSGEMTQKIGQYIEKKLGGVVDHLFKFFDAWAVASFTVIGVGVAVEMKADPLWLWGPAMGVLTASGGVVLRDIVRADFNIEMLKQDTYAEISLLGGIVYTFLLMSLPSDISLELIFYLTMIVIALLFGIRFFILWKGWENPLQFGAMHTHPDTRLRQFIDHEPDLWKQLTHYYTEDDQGRALPASHSELEGLHNRFLYAGAELRDLLDQVAAEPLNEDSINKYRHCNSRLDIATSLETNLYTFTRQPTGFEDNISGPASELLQRIHESLKTMIETISMAVESKDHLDFTMLEGLTSKYQERFNDLRGRYSAEGREKDDPYLNAVLRSTHKVERVIYLLGDYVRLRLDKKETRTGSASSRKAQQTHLLH
jgi:polar amino acid transport system substrate-binding protein